MKEAVNSLVTVCIFCVVAGMAGYICGGTRTGKMMKTALSVLVLFTAVIGFGTAVKNIKPNLFGGSIDGYSDNRFEYDTEAAVIKICGEALENIGITGEDIYYEENTLCVRIDSGFSDKADDAEQILKLLTGDDVKVIGGKEQNE